MTKKLVSLFLAALVVLAGLSSLSALAEGEATISFAYFGADEEIAIKQEVLDAFAAKFPNIKVEGTFTVGLDFPLKLQTWFAAQNAPDVLAIALDVMSPFKGIGVYEDLRPYMERDGLLDGSTWDQSLVDAFTYTDGAIQAAPYVSKLHALIYNKTMFDEAGLSYPTEDWTEEEFLAAARALTKGEDMTEKTFGFYWGWQRQEMMLNLYGNKPAYDPDTMTMNIENNEEFRHAFELMIGMIRDEKIAIDSSTRDSVGGGFETGRFGMAMQYSMIENTQALIGDTFEWGVTKLPVHEEFGRWSPTIRLDGYCMYSGSKEKDAAWELIKFITASEEGQKISSQLGIPALQSVANDESFLTDYNGGTPYDKEIFTKMTEYAHLFDWAGIYVEVNQAIEDQYQLVLFDGLDIDTAIADAHAEGEMLFETVR